MRKLIVSRNVRSISIAVSTVALLSACSGGESGGSTGGASSTGGATTQGGATSNGGAPAQGGATSGGANSSGGATPTSGGNTTSGGALSTGGATSGGSASGGTSGAAQGGGGSSAGGAQGSGGSKASGGSTTGGAKASGGAGGTASGGTTSGGAKASGGASGTTGGSAGKGGSTSSGGSAGGSSCPTNLVGFATVEGGTTGGGTVAPTTVTTQAELKACATATEPRVCRVQGTLTFDPFEEIRVKSNKTIIGAGANATIVMGGFMLEAGVNNVIIRNMTIRDSKIEGDTEGGDRDGVQMDTAHHIWIDHMRFARLGDGQIDSRKDNTFLTVSWNILEEHDKAFGIGWTENVTAQMTIHHNWLRDTNQRNPSTDNVLRAHLFNNLLENQTSYGNYSRGGTNMVLQNSVFVNVKDPHYYDTGTLVAIGNIYRNTTGQREQSGTTFSFFDPSTFYSYTLDPADQVEALVKRCAGPRADIGN